MKGTLLVGDIVERIDDKTYAGIKYQVIKTNLQRSDYPLARFRQLTAHHIYPIGYENNWYESRFKKLNVTRKVPAWL
jgi:hypothetical protein